MDAGVNPVTKRDVAPQLGEFSVDGQAVAVRACVRNQREAIAAGHVHVGSDSLQQRPDSLAAIKEEFYRRDAGATDRSMTCRVAWVRRRTLRKCLWQQVAAVLRVDDGKDR